MLNKLDLLPEDERDAHCQDIIKRLDWQKPVYQISAVSRLGTTELAQHIMQYMDDPELFYESR